MSDDTEHPIEMEAGLPVVNMDTEECSSDDLIDVTGVAPEEVIMPSVTTSGEVLREEELTPRKRHPDAAPDVLEEEVVDLANCETVYSSFPCQVIPETLSRMTRTPPDGEHLQVHKNANGRLRIFVKDHQKKFSVYSNLTHKPCTVCNRQMKSGEMHLNFPADLDRRRIWANLLGFKYKDILRSKMGPVSFSIAAGPICTEHFAEECFRNHNFNKSAIEAFGVPVAISPDVKTTPSKKRVPWVCTICEFHSCSVVELQSHLLDHTEEMLKKKDSVLDVPEAGFMCPFCRKCTYGYKTISGYRRHLNSAPIHHCHLRRIYEFAKMNCRSTELDPSDKWDNWTRRNVYVAYHGCEPPANEIVLTPSPTKSAYVQNPEERTRIVHDEDRRRKAVRSLAFVGKEGGTSVNDHNVMQRAVYLQVRRNLEHKKKYPGPDDEEEVDELEQAGQGEKVGDAEKEKTPEVVEKEVQEGEEEEVDKGQSPQLPMGSEKRKSQRLRASGTLTPPPVKPKLTEPLPKKRKMTTSSTDSSHEPSPVPTSNTVQQKERDEMFAKMVAKRSQQVKRLIAYKKFNKEKTTPTKPRKAVSYALSKEKDGEGHESEKTTEEEEFDDTTPSEQTPEPTTSTAPATRKSARFTEKAKAAPPPPPAPVKVSKAVRSVKFTPKEEPKEVVKKPEERPLKSMLARSLAGGERPSMAKYRMPINLSSSGSSLTSSPSITTTSPMTSSSTSPVKGGGLFSKVAAAAQDKAPSKRPTVLTRRPLILSPRKKGLFSSVSSSVSQPIGHHEGSPIFPSSAIEVVDEEILISSKDLEVQDEQIITTDGVPASSKPVLTLAEALELKNSEGVNNQELEEISNEFMRDAAYYRTMEEAYRARNATKNRQEMRLSRHCMRQIEAARARARLFGEGSEDQYQIYYSHDGAQVVSKNDPKWRELQQQQYPEDEHQ